MTCRCGHTGHDHDAGECWAQVDGQQCWCDWWEPTGQPPTKAVALDRALQALDAVPAAETGSGEACPAHGPLPEGLTEDDCPACHGIR